MTNLVSVPGRNISASQCGIGLNIEKPRIRYRPSSALTWMSLITSGVKMLLCPSTALPSASIVVTCAYASQCSQDELAFGRLELDAVDPERCDLPADVDRTVVHRVAKAAAHVPADDLPAALEHEARHHARVAADDDGAALLVDARPGPDVAADHHVAAAQGGSGERPGVLVDQDHAGHHVLGRRPAHPAADVDLGLVEPAGVIADLHRCHTSTSRSYGS